MLTFDAHLDLAWNAIDWNRDLLQPVAEIRRSEAGMTAKARGCNTVSFPDLRRGQVGIFIATLLARLYRAGLMPAAQRYSSMESAHAATMGQLHYYRVLVEKGVLRFIKDAATLETHVQAWLKDPVKTSEPL